MTTVINIYSDDIFKLFKGLHLKINRSKYFYTQAMSLMTSQRTTNFMNGCSFKMSPLQTLRIVMTSMISGEAQYYRPSLSINKDKSKGQLDASEDLKDASMCKIDSNSHMFKEYFLFSNLYSNPKNKENIVINESNLQQDVSDVVINEVINFIPDDVNTYMTKIVSDTLDDDFEGCIDLIAKLRDEYMMRLNPQILLVSALLHKNRESFNKTHPRLMKSAIRNAGVLPTDLCKQYELIKKAGINPPSIWKRSVSEKLEDMSRYHAIKYINGSKSGNIMHVIESKKALTNLVDLVRITHPVGKPGSVIEELVKTGKVKSVDLEEDTWERLRSSGKTWKDILSTIRIPHMALLRNLRNIIQEFSQTDDIDQSTNQSTNQSTHTSTNNSIDHSEELRKIGKQLVDGVLGGKQFPFRYFSAFRSLKDTTFETFGSASDRSTRSDKLDKSSRSSRLNKQEEKPQVKPMNPNYVNIISDALESCLQKSLSTIPQLEGRVDCLTDNSGSAHGAFVSEYGSVKVAEISNLSAILTAMRSTEGGSVWVFGDTLKEFVIDKNGSILDQLEQVNKIGQTIGGGTETGIWLFWDKMIKEMIHLDTVFIYSDQQAGYGGLYADNKLKDNIANYMFDKPSFSNCCYIDVLKLVNTYRETVNTNMNLFSVQVAGYNNSIIPSLIYRGAILSGWTGKEAKMAYEMIKVWDEITSTSV